MRVIEQSVPRLPAPVSHRRFELAVLPGDGIGAEVVEMAVRVLGVVEHRLEGVEFDFNELQAGAGEYLRSGDPLPEGVFAACRRADAVLLGPMGLPEVRWPDGLELTPQIDLRERLDLYCGLRPIRLFAPADSPLKRPGLIDLLLVRENTEGLFSARHQARSHRDEAFDTLRVTRRGSERVFRAAFREARRRRHKVTLVDKANVLPSMVFFRAVFDEVAREFPDVETERVYVDAAALLLLQCPARFDVLVTENMFGDILSDLAASLVGGMGLAPSADIGEQSAVFTPAHGSAPDLIGKGIANPVAMILSAAMLLEWLGTPETRRGASLVRGAVEATLRDPAKRTPDLGGRLTTRAMADCIVAALE